MNSKGIELSGVVETPAPLDASYTLPMRAGGVFFGAAVPGVQVRPTSASERQHLDASHQESSNARQVWSSMPDVDYSKTMHSMTEARTLVNNDSNADSSWRASPERHVASRASSAASSGRFSGCTHSRPGSGPSRTAARQQSTSIGATQTSLLAAEAQNMLSSALELDRPSSPASSTTGLWPRTTTEATEGRGASVLCRGPPASAFLHSLRSGSAVIRVRSTRHSAERRRLTTAPVSLLRGFEERVRCTTPYQPVSSLVPAATPPVVAACGTTPSTDGWSPPPSRNNVTVHAGGDDEGGSVPHTTPLSAKLRLGPAVVQPRVQSTGMSPSMPFHMRGEYTSNIVDDTLQDLGYYSFERQKVLDIHEKGMLVKEAVVHAKMEKAMMSDLRHDTMQQTIAFWRQHRPPNVIDLERMLPGRGSNTRDLNVMVGQLVDCCEHPGPQKAVRFVEGLGDDPTVGSSPLWSRKERDRFFRFMGKAPPSAPPPTNASPDAPKKLFAGPQAATHGKPPMGRRQ